MRTSSSDILHLGTPAGLGREYVQLPQPPTARGSRVGPEHYIPLTVTSPVEAFGYLKMLIPFATHHPTHKRLYSFSSTLVAFVEKHGYLAGFSARAIALSCIHVACTLFDHYLSGHYRFGISYYAVKDGYNALWLRRSELEQVFQLSGMKCPLPWPEMKDGKSKQAIIDQDRTGKRYDDQTWKKYMRKAKGLPSPLGERKVLSGEHGTHVVVHMSGGLT